VKDRHIKKSDPTGNKGEKSREKGGKKEKRGEKRFVHFNPRLAKSLG